MHASQENVAASAVTSNCLVGVEFQNLGTDVRNHCSVCVPNEMSCAARPMTKLQLKHLPPTNDYFRARIERLYNPRFGIIYLLKFH